MGYSTVYAIPDSAPAEGDPIASTTGWWSWTNAVLARGGEFPELAHLAAFGWSDRFDDLEHELDGFLHADPDADLSAITAQVLAAVRGRPEGTAAILVTDGEPADDETAGDETAAESKDASGHDHATDGKFTGPGGGGSGSGKSATKKIRRKKGASADRPKTDAKGFLAESPDGGPPLERKAFDNVTGDALVTLRPQLKRGKWVWGEFERKPVTVWDDGELADHLELSDETLADPEKRGDALDKAMLHKQKNRPLTPLELWAAGLPGGEAPPAGEIDWRPGETIPEDYYAESILREDHGPPPFPGAVFDTSSHRWKLPAHDATDHTGAHPAETKAKSLASRIAEVPKALASRVASWVAAKHEKLAGRYGSKGAKAILAGMILLAPTPVPGSSLIPIALAEAVLRLSRVIAGSREAIEPELSAEEVEKIARQLLAELESDMKAAG